MLIIFWLVVSLCRIYSEVIDSDYQIVSGDILIPKSPDGAEGAAYYAHFKQWPKAKDGLYHIQYDYSSMRPSMQKTIQYALDYLMSGSNIIFEPVKNRNSPHLKFNRPADSGQCLSFMGAGEAYGKNSGQTVDLGDNCETVHVVLHEVMHALGFNHEQDRVEATRYFKGLRPAEVKITPVTPYDMFSIMHYSSDYIIKPVGLSKDMEEASYGRRVFMSTCDWHALNTLYTGRKKPPDCIPNVAHDPLIPSDFYIKKLGSDLAHKLCRTAAEIRFKIDGTGDCRLPDGRKFPDMSWIPEGDPVYHQVNKVPKPDKFFINNAQISPDTMAFFKKPLNGIDCDTTDLVDNKNPKTVWFAAKCTDFEAIDNYDDASECVRMCNYCSRYDHLTIFEIYNCVRQSYPSCVIVEPSN